MTKQISFTLLIFLFTTSVLLGCYFKKGNNGTDASSEVSFENDVSKILTSKCGTSGCHAGATPQGGLNLNVDDSDLNTLYTSVMTEVNVDAPEESPLLAKASNTETHTGGEVLATSSEDYQTVLMWITDGAFNDNCEGVPHGFASDVTPILTDRCTNSGCHDVTVPIFTSNAFENISGAKAINIDSPLMSSLLRKPLGLDSHTGGTIFPSKNDDYKTIYCWIKVDQAIDN